jgi:glycosyltransferase involved in cell wall biosynthesis
VTHPRVSVVIPTYNRAHLIGESIQSVLTQTFRDFELIVVDDGSSDDTETVVRRFGDPRIRYTYQENKGISGAQNTGIRTAKGGYIAFLGSDDLWLPALLQLEVEILGSNPDVGLAYAKAQAIDTDGNLKSQISGTSQKYPGDTLKSALYGNFVCTIAALMRRECFDRVGLFDETLKARVDYDMWIRMAKHYRFAYLDRVLAHFRIHSGRYTRVKSEHFAQVCTSRIKVLDKAFADPDLSEDILSTKPIAYRNAYMDIGLGWLSSRTWRESVRNFRKAIRISPNPLLTPFRILWLILVYNILSKSRWGSRLISALVDLKRRRRTALVV